MNENYGIKVTYEEDFYHSEDGDHIDISVITEDRSLEDNNLIGYVNAMLIDHRVADPLLYADSIDSDMETFIARFDGKDFIDYDLTVIVYIDKIRVEEHRQGIGSEMIQALISSLKRIYEQWPVTILLGGVMPIEKRGGYSDPFKLTNFYQKNGFSIVIDKNKGIFFQTIEND